MERGVPQPAKDLFTPPPLPSRLSRLPLHQIFIPSLPKANSPQFVLISYSFDTQVMLILILIDVQYSQNVVFLVLKKVRNAKITPPGCHHLGG